MLDGSSVRPGTLWKAEVEKRPTPALPAGSAWTWDVATGQYYLHSFLKQQPDVNWRNPAVQDAMFEDMRFLLERGVV
jgi:glycosidase